MTTSACSPLQRIKFATADPAEAREFLGQAYGSFGGFRVAKPADGDWLLSVRQVRIGGFSSSDMRLPAELEMKITGHDDEACITTITDGRASIRRGKATSRYRPGDVFIASCPQADWDCETHQVRHSTILLPGSLLREAAGRPARPGRPWQVLSYEPLAGTAGQWGRTVRFVDALLAQPDAAAAPLVTGQALRLLAATALTIFPGIAASEPTIADRHDGHPQTLRRAIAFIEVNPDRDISVADIAAAARVTSRAVQLAFRRHLGTTPMGYLRRVRLDHAHRELLAADPDQETVTDIAYRWGFGSASRFSAYYRDSYGILPSQTLHS
jgi:AraC-like DNA-binding protein